MRFGEVRISTRSEITQGLQDFLATLYTRLHNEVLIAHFYLKQLFKYVSYDKVQNKASLWRTINYYPINWKLEIIFLEGNDVNFETWTV